MVLPDTVLQYFSQYRRYVDGGLSLVQQRAMGLFMREGYYSRHLRKMRKLYLLRKQVLDEAVAALFPKWQRLPSQGGMHSVYLLPEGENDQLIVKIANANGFGIRALSAYSRVQEIPKGLIFGYAALYPDSIMEQLYELKNCLMRAKGFQ